ncbi:MAG: hypothetical protein V4636_07855 [Pseudomonadota bacterium]
MRTFAVVATAVLLAACGGGGGGSEGGSLAASNTPVSVAPGSSAPEEDAASSSEDAVEAGGLTQTTSPVPASAVTAGRSTDLPALQAAVLQTLQAERRRCGFSLLVRDANLDQAAVNHGLYLANEYANGRKGSHAEAPGSTGFTGETASARAKAVGYAPRTVGEAFAHSNLDATDAAIARAPTPTDRAVSHTEFLLSTVYHMQALLLPRADLGVGYAEQRGADVFTQVTVMEFGAKTGVPNTVQSDVLTYPCEGTTAVRPSFTPSKETPNPMPSTGDGTVGTPLYIRAPEGSVLALTSSSVTASDGNAVATTVLNSTNDPEKRLTQAQIFVVPQSALIKGKSYQVNFNGTVDGKAFNRTFSFTPN